MPGEQVVKFTVENGCKCENSEWLAPLSDIRKHGWAEMKCGKCGGVVRFELDKKEEAE